MLADYEGRPGPEVQIPNSISPAKLNCGLSNSSESPTVLFFYHPKCPCTFATARCLQRLSVKFSADVQIVAFAYRPAQESDSWIESRTTRLLKSIAGTQVLVDPDGKTTKDFGVVTSGHFLIYGADRNLVFSGGITPSRGHEGDSRASSQFIHSVNRYSREFTSWPVFGCSIVATE